LALTIAGAPWFEAPPVRAIFRALNRDGHEARIVGGAVRNTLMGLPVSDVDFATTAAPEEVAKFARKAGLKPVATGLRHGTITLVAEGRPFEVTTLRQDVETHGRHATVCFTRDWTSDAKRRDFTMNALYAAEDGRIYDPLGGYHDLRARHVYFIGLAHERIREDYLRILRFFRFTAEYSAEGPDRVGFQAAVMERKGLAQLSAERVHAELLRILAARQPMLALEPMTDGGFLTSILGGVVHLAHFERLAVLEKHLGMTPDPVRRLAALAVMIEEDAGRLTGRLRLSNAEAARLEGMAALHPVIHAGLEEARARQMLYRVKDATWRDRVLIAWAREGGDPASGAWRALLTLPERWQAPEFPLKGRDLLNAGLERGPGIGETLLALEEAWIASGFALSREELLARSRQ
jgi:tRNA nucleotidyltransferase/poly(A) polymerase